MLLFSPELHRRTPDVSVFDNSGLIVREIHYHRHPDIPDVTDERITRHHHDAHRHLVSSTDPRLYDFMQQRGSQIRPNFQHHTSLTGEALKTVSADAGTALLLKDAAGRPTVSRNAEGTVTQWHYEPDRAGRLFYISEKATGEKEKITERFVYAKNTPENRTRNLASICTTHYDTSGVKHSEAMSLTGAALSVTQQLLRDDEAPDWRGDDECVWRQKLSPEVYRTVTTYDVTGALLTQQDAMGNVTHSQYNVAGLMKSSTLQLKDEVTATHLFKKVTWSASWQKQQEIHGNGVISTYTREPETQRLTGIRIERPITHPKGAKIFQDLHYSYDPVGNVLSVQNMAEKTHFWRNRKVEPKNTYLYDTLYQQVCATGREMAAFSGIQTHLPNPISPLDNTLYVAYTRQYNYDRANNLTRIRHHAPETKNRYTTDILISEKSNRGVLWTEGLLAEQVDNLFHPGGNQKSLLKGQPLAWTHRGELANIRMTATDTERYRYDARGQRVTKLTTRHHSGTIHTEKVIYLGSLEIRTRHQNDTLKEELHRINTGNIQFLHWETPPPDSIENNQQRHSHNDLINSSGLELDQNGELISREEYYPYGGTSVWAARNQTEADYKTIRYSGKERDTSGLYYYGYRYYQSWLGRWLSADPVGTIDGLNLYRMVRNNPVKSRDTNGLMTETESAYYEYFVSAIKPKILERAKKDEARALARLQEKTNVSGQTLGDLKDFAVKKIINANLSVNFNTNKINLFRSSSGLKNIYSIPSREKSDEYIKKRNFIEHKIIDIGDMIYSDYDFGMNEGRPKYGALSFDKSSGEGAAPLYGNGVFYLKENMKNYVTLSPFDSMSVIKSKKKLTDCRFQIPEELFYSNDSLTIARYQNSFATFENPYPLIADANDIRLEFLINKDNGESPQHFEFQSWKGVNFNEDIESFWFDPARPILHDAPLEIPSLLKPSSIKEALKFSEKFNVKWTNKPKYMGIGGLLSR